MVGLENGWEIRQGANESVNESVAHVSPEMTIQQVNAPATLTCCKSTQR